MKAKVKNSKKKVVGIPVYNYLEHGITQSVLSRFLQCRYACNLGLAGWHNGKFSESMTFGDIAHDCIGKIYGTHKAPPKQAAMNKLIAASIERFKRRYAIVTPEMLSALAFIEAKLHSLLPAYFAFWFEADFQETKWGGLEETFSERLFLPGPNDFLARGKFDGWFWDRPGGIWLFETKTKGQIDAGTIASTIGFDLQVMFYILSLRSKLRKHIKGVRYNIIRNPGLRLGVKETLEEYTDRLAVHIANDPKHYFLRFNEPIDADEQARFAAKTLSPIIHEFIAVQRGDMPAFQNPTACVQKYGACQYLQHCTSDDFVGYQKRDVLFPELEEE